MTFDEFGDRLGSLRLDRSGGLVKPYKPLMVAAVVVLMHKGKIASRHVYLDGGLRSAFAQMLTLLYPSWPRRANPAYPFRHLENDGVWRLVPHDGATDELRAAKSAHAEAWTVLRHVRCAELDPAVAERLSERALEEHIEAHWEETPFAALGVRLSRPETTKLRLAVSANPALSLWRFDERLRLRPVG